MPELIDGEGNFTDSFRTEVVPQVLGEDHKDFKGLDDIKNVQGLAKAFVETKSTVGRMAKKYDGAIIPPGEDADDDARSEYTERLLMQLGVPETTEGYELPTVEEVPDEVRNIYDEEFVGFFKDKFLEHKVPPTIAKAMTAEYTNYMTQQLKMAAKASDEKFQDQLAVFEGNHPGDKKVESLRLAVKAMKSFLPPDMGRKFDKAKLYENPGDFQKWREMGIWPEQLEIWTRVGAALGDGPALRNEGGNAPAKAVTKAMYPNSPELTGAR